MADPHDVIVWTSGAARVSILERIANLWRGDWSGHCFDGRDGNRWITTAMEGDAEALGELARELAGYEEDQ